MRAVEESAEPGRKRLTELRNVLLRHHKILLDSERAAYEHEIARIHSSNEFLALVLHDPWFAWLHELSELVVLIDEMLGDEEPIPVEEADRLVSVSRALITPDENGAGFAKRYFDAMQRDPDVVLAHGDAARSIGNLRRT